MDAIVERTRKRRPHGVVRINAGFLRCSQTMYAPVIAVTASEALMYFDMVVNVIAIQEARPILLMTGIRIRLSAINPPTQNSLASRCTAFIRIEKSGWKCDAAAWLTLARSRRM